MKYYAIPKQDATTLGELFGDFFGVSVEVRLSPNQKWAVRKAKKYYWLTKNGKKLRLTETALCRLFDLAEVQDGQVRKDDANNDD